MYSMTKFKILPKIEDFAEKEDEKGVKFSDFKKCE